jgi:hypothetical protein
MLDFWNAKEAEKVVKKEPKALLPALSFRKMNEIYHLFCHNQFLHNRLSFDSGFHKVDACR